MLIKFKDGYWADFSKVKFASKRVSWRNSEGCVITIGNNTEEKEIKILKYNDTNKTVDIEVDNKLHTVKTNRLRQVEVVEFLKKSHYKLGETVGEYKIEEVLQNSNGFSYIIKCTKCDQFSCRPIKENEIKKGLGGKQIHDSWVCPLDSLYQHKHLHHFIVNLEGSKKVAPNSHKKILVKCPDCNEKKKISPADLTRYGMSCTNCSDKTSFLEKFMASYFRVKNIKYIHQKTFKDLGRRKFDFYLPEFNAVCEVHGLQHYKEIEFYGSTKTMESDKEKKEYCKKKKIKYIEIDGSKHNIFHLVDSVKASDLENITEKELGEIMRGINMGYIDTKQIIKDKQNNMSAKEIAKKHNLSESTIYKMIRHFKNAYNTSEV